MTAPNEDSQQEPRCWRTGLPADAGICDCQRCCARDSGPIQRFDLPEPIEISGQQVYAYCTRCDHDDCDTIRRWIQAGKPKQTPTPTVESDGPPTTPVPDPNTSDEYRAGYAAGIRHAAEAFEQLAEPPPLLPTAIRRTVNRLRQTADDSDRSPTHAGPAAGTRRSRTTPARRPPPTTDHRTRRRNR